MKINGYPTRHYRVTKRKGSVVVNQLYSPMDLIRADDEKREMERKKKDEVEKRRKEEAEAKETRRVASTCASPGCTKRSNKAGKAAGWSICPHCEAIFCRPHLGVYNEHITVCAEMKMPANGEKTDHNDMVGV